VRKVFETVDTVSANLEPEDDMSLVILKGDDNSAPIRRRKNFKKIMRQYLTVAIF
jgi:hypothetical protein